MRAIEQAKTHGEAAPADPEHRARNLAALWYGLLGGPIVWFFGLLAGYPLVEVACTKRSMFPLHLGSVVALSLVLGAGWAAWSQWSRVGRGWASEASDARTRSRFMAVMGVILSALFAMAIGVQWLATAFLHPCMGI
jgi:hypothetical protein